MNSLKLREKRAGLIKQARALYEERSTGGQLSQRMWHNLTTL